MLRSLIIVALLASAPAAGSAQTTTSHGGDTISLSAESQQPAPVPAPKRIRSITLTGNQSCPKSAGDEIVVCARTGEPYRIPKELRDDKPIPAQNQSWVNRAALADDVGRRAAGLPDTCSPTGSGGQTGCALLRAQQYAAEKAQAKRDAAVIP